MLRSGIIKIAALAAGLFQEIIQGAVAIFEFRVHVLTLHGAMRGSKDGRDATMLYVGRSLNLPHFKKKFFEEATTIGAQKTNLITYRKHMNAAQADADVVFVDIGWPYNKRINKHGDYLELPDWVCMVTPLAESWDATVQTFRKTMRKNIRRLIRKNNYRCEATNDPAMAASFYDEYYNAFINSRHSGEVFMTPRLEVEQRAREGTILQVIGADGPVAAGVYFPKGDTLCLLATGMPEALVDTPPEAAMSALFYFSLQYAFDNSYKAVNFMGTRAFPNDGLFQFKRKWGAMVTDEFSIDSILFKPMDNSPKAAEFCELFPFVARKGKNLELVLCSTAQDLSDQDRDRIVSNAHCAGLDPVRLVHVTDQAASTEQYGGDREPTVNVIRTTLTAFSGAYAGKTAPVPNHTETPLVIANAPGSALP